MPPCVVCGGREFVPMFGSAKAAPPKASHTVYRITHSPRDHVRGIVRCVKCRLGVLPPDLRNDTAAAYAQGEDPYYLQQAAERIANAGLLVEQLPPGGKLLDVGCACGFLLVAAREHGFKVQGVEPSAWAANYARKEYNLDVFHGLLDQAPFAPRSFDVITLADVIEHLTDPRAVVRGIHRLLAPGGRILVYTPDIDSLVAKVARTHWWGLLDDHYHYFNRTNLTQLLESEGFTVEHITAVGRQFPLKHWVFKLGQYNATVERILQKCLHNLRLDEVRITINFFDQMVCVARKN